MTITFLYHSSFLVELQTCSLLFDWYGGDIPPYNREKPLYVLASHHHGDHYSPEIFKLLGMDGVFYILSNTIRLSAKRKAAYGIDDTHVLRLGSDWVVEVGPLTVTTIPSTDEGIAFFVEVEGKTIFHAGDLNWWHWAEEPDFWNQDMEQNFKRYCQRCAGRVADAAFLVLDPRQGEQYWWGFDYMMRTLQCKAAFPMHSWGEFWISKKLKERPESEPYRNLIQDVRYSGQRFTLPSV